MINHSIEVSAIPAFNDNYIWLLKNAEGRCALVDPGDHAPVTACLREHKLELDTILVTHHHADHVGGIPALLEHWPARVVAPHDGRIVSPDLRVTQGDTVKVLGCEFTVIEVPGHTRSHIAYFGQGMLFCGDTLFSLGCGRLFEGTPEQMQQSLDKLAELPPETLVFCAHEYTQSNARFALEVEPGNDALQSMSARIDALRMKGQMTLPSTLGRELAANPFLRTREPTVVAAARKKDASAQPGASTMAVIRSWKDRF